VIVATAGHIDHGKTILVKALTGIDTDRLPEEKRRGMTIDLGFAYHSLASGEVLGFVDVPGHERFIHNMLAGVTGIDFALIVVAADDGPMPQTEEHVAILDLLGVRAGAVALTKIDRVDAARIAAAREEIEILLAGTGLEDLPVFPVSGLTGAGVPALARQLEDTAQALGARGAAGRFRLAIDRCFTVAGAGLVVTGTVFAGIVRSGDHVVVTPGAGRGAGSRGAGQRVRVRGLHTQNREAGEGHAGQRCAVNLAGPGLARAAVHRGDWLVAEGGDAPTARLDARLRLLATERRPLRHWTPVHVHLGAADVTGRVAILHGGAVAPGAEAQIQLVLDRAVGALYGDRLILRDQSATRTIAGGRVIDPFAPTRGRARPQRLTMLAEMENDDTAAALAAMLDAAPSGVDLARLAIARNLTADEATMLWQAAPMVRIGAEDGAIAPARWQTLKRETLEALAAWHGKWPDRYGPGVEQLRGTLASRAPAALFKAVVEGLLADDAIQGDGMYLKLPGHTPVMAPKDRRLWADIRPLLADGHLKPPVVHEIARTLGMGVEPVSRFLARAVGLGLVVRIAPNRFALPEAVVELGEIAETLAAEAADGLVTAAAFRDRSGIGRNLTIQVLEFFDDAGLTRRIKDARQVMRRAHEVFRAAST
jgi:selenocysteine-specific elongation factor